MRLFIVMLVLTSAVHAAEERWPASRPVFHRKFSRSISHSPPGGGYAVEAFAAANEKLAAALHGRFKDSFVQCLLAPRGYGYDIEILSHHQLAEEDVRHILDLEREFMPIELSLKSKQKRANKAPEPTTRLVTIRAAARLAPSQVVAHL